MFFRDFGLFVVFFLGVLSFLFVLAKNFWLVLSFICFEFVKLFLFVF